MFADTTNAKLPSSEQTNNYTIKR